MNQSAATTSGAHATKVWQRVRLLLSVVILLVAAVVFLIPFFWMVMTSLKTLREVSIFPPPIFPAVPQFQNYATAFARAPLLRYGLNSLIVCVSVIVLTGTLSMLAAYTLVFLEFRFKELVYLVLLAPQMVAGVILLLPLFAVLQRLSLLNKLPSLIIPYSVLYCPFSIMLLRGYLSTIPREMVEAARVDGATEIWTLARVVFPLARPALATIALFCFIWSWNEFLFALVYIQKPAMRTISVGLALLQSLPEFPPEMNIIMAAAASVTLPVLLLFTLAQRQFIQGMTAGAVK